MGNCNQNPEKDNTPQNTQVDFTCVVYSGEDLKYLDTVKGDNLEQLVQRLDDLISDSDLVNSLYTHFDNVGGEVELTYEKLVGRGYNVRTLKTEGALQISQQQDVVVFKITPDLLQNTQGQGEEVVVLDPEFPGKFKIKRIKSKDGSITVSTDTDGNIDLSVNSESIPNTELGNLGSRGVNMVVRQPDGSNKIRRVTSTDQSLTFDVKPTGEVDLSVANEISGGAVTYNIVPSTSVVTIKRDGTVIPQGIQVYVTKLIKSVAQNVTTGKVSYRIFDGGAGTYGNEIYINPGETIDTSDLKGSGSIDLKYYVDINQPPLATFGIVINKEAEDPAEYEDRYAVNNSEVIAPQLDVNADNPEGWELDPPFVTPGNRYLWKTSAKKKSGVLVGTWSTPYRITGIQGASGEVLHTGVVVTIDNPIQVVAVGSDGVLDIAKETSIKFSVNNGEKDFQAVPLTSQVLNNRYYIKDVIGLPSGITVSRGATSDIMVVRVAEGTYFKDETLSIPFKLEIGVANGKIERTINFQLVPNRKADDGIILDLNTSTTIIKVNSVGQVIFPQSPIKLTANQQGYDDTVVWQVFRNENPVPVTPTPLTGAGLNRELPVNVFSDPVITSLKVRVSTENGMFDEVSIVKVSDGSNGLDGEIGSTGLVVGLSNPIQVVAVGSDGRLEKAYTFKTEVLVNRGTMDLEAIPVVTEIDEGYFSVDSFPSPPTGIVITKDTGNPSELNVRLNPNIVFPEETINIPVGVKVVVDGEIIDKTTNLQIVPNRKAADGIILDLVSSTNVVKMNKNGTVLFPTTPIQLHVTQKNYTETVVWQVFRNDTNQLIEPSPLKGSGLDRTLPTDLFMESGLNAVRIRIHTSNGMYDETSIVKISDGMDGAPGTSGSSGVVVTSSNPVQVVAVGSDGKLNQPYTFSNSYFVNSGSQEYQSVATLPEVRELKFWIQDIANPMTGVTITKDTTNRNKINITLASGTVFPETTLTVPVKFTVGLPGGNVERLENLQIVFNRKAEDGTGLDLITSSNIVKINKQGVVSYPDTSITLQAVQKNSTDTITWQVYKNEESSPILPLPLTGTATVKQLATDTFLDSSVKAIRVRISTSNGMFDETSIVRVSDGLDGPPGVGTTGPVPRMFEWKKGAIYQKDANYKDFIYYRTAGPLQGWWTAAQSNAVLNGVGVAAGEFPVEASDKFHKEPFEKMGTFGTIIAEQANLAGFIFRDKVLTSQDTSFQSCTTTDDRGPFPNLTIDGIKGIIKFLEKMVLSKDGIVIKDDCGRVRMAFMFEGGVPVLRFYDENSVVLWEAGQNNFGGTTLAFFSPQTGIKTNLPLDNEVPEDDTPITELNPYIETISGMYRVKTPIENIYGQKYVKLNPAVPTLPEHNKTYKTASLSSGTVDDGWYVTSVVNAEPRIHGNAQLIANFVKIVAGDSVKHVSRRYQLASTNVYRTYYTDMYGGSGDVLYVTWTDKDGNNQAYSERGESGAGTQVMSFSVCALEGSFTSNGSIVKGGIC